MAEPMNIINKKIHKRDKQLIAMQKKRLKPEVFMNEEVDVENEIMGNQFNLVLKDSLLNTGLERIHANKRELRLNHLD